LIDVMCLGIVNYTALARYIESDVNKIVDRKVSIDAIKMALIRFSEKICEAHESMYERARLVVEKSSLELKSDICVVTIRREAVMMNMERVAKLAAKTRFFQMTQGLKSFTIAISREDLDELIEIVGRENVEDLQLDQVAILIVSPMEIINTPGVVAFISTVLALNGINITHIVSCYRDTIIVVKRDDALRAYEVLENALRGKRY